MSKDQMEAAKAFEAYMVEMMVKEMRKTIPDGMFSGESTEIFSGLFDQEISKRIAETGGFGFDEVMGQALNGERLAPQPSSYIPMVTYQPVASNPAASVHDHDHDHHHHHHHHHDHGPGEMPVEGVITSRFGLRSDPFHGKTRHHKGLDIAAPTGTPIHPVRPGTVVSSGERGGYGNVVVLDHGDGTTSLYAHCHEAQGQEGGQGGLRRCHCDGRFDWSLHGTSPPPGGASRWQGRRSDGRIEALASKHRPLGQQDGPEMKFLLQNSSNRPKRECGGKAHENSGLASAVSPDVDNRHPGGPANNRQVVGPKHASATQWGKPSGCRS